MAQPQTPDSIAVLSKSVDAAIKKYFVDEYKEHPNKLEVFYNVDTLANHTDEMTGFTGLSGTFQTVAEGGTYPTDAPIATYNTNFTGYKKGVMEQITWEMSMWSRTDKLTNAGAKLAKALRRSIGKDAAGVMTGGFATPASEVSAYGDSKNFYSISHTRADGGTAISNASSTGLVLSEANLWTAIIALQNQLDDRGETIDVSGIKLIVPEGTANQKTAMILVGSTGRPETADNDYNLYKGFIDLVTWKYLSGTSTGTAAHSNYWYLQAADHGLTWLWGKDRGSLQKDESTGFDNDVVKYKIRYERAYGFADFRGNWASKGDGAGYSS